MFIHTKEHYELIEFFERAYKGMRLDREKNRELWKSENVYENGETNKLFLAFRAGYFLGKAIQYESTFTQHKEVKQ